jgi:hypothetical protein
MPKKNLLAITIFFVVIVVVFLGYLYIKKESLKVVEPIHAVPSDAAIIIETTDIHNLIRRLHQDNLIWQELSHMDNTNRLNQQILFLDSLFQHSRTVKQVIQNSTVVISIHKTGKEKADLIYLLNIPVKFNQNQLNEIVSEISLHGKVTERIYSSVKIHEIEYEYSQGAKKLSYAISGGVLMLSYSSILLEKTIRQLGLTTTIDDQAGFQKVANTAGKNVEANIYINYKTFPKLISVFLNNRYRQQVEQLTQLAEWTELDVNLKDETILFNGFTFTNDTMNNYLNMFIDQSPRNLETDQILPANTAAFIALGINDFAKFHVDFSRFLERSGQINSYRNNIQQANEVLGENIEELFYSFLENEIVIAFSDLKNLTREENTYVICKTKSKSLAEESLLNLLSNYGSKTNQKMSSFVFSYNVDAETSCPIYRMPVHFLPEKLFGALFAGTGQCEYFTFINNYLVFANSIQALSKLIHNHILHKTLYNDIQYREFSEYLSSRSNFLLYLNIPRAPVIFSDYLKKELQKSINKQFNNLKKLQALAIQFSSNNSMLYNNVFLKYQSVFREEAQTVWESLLDTSIQFKPEFVTNHYNRSKEIFIQDLNNNIYLINAAGRILWKVQIPEKILGHVYQIDFYRNNKLQYLFNTKNYIHLIDRNGNNVERFPVKLRSRATNGISLFDYEKNKDYRIFVAGEDQKIYVYNKEGNVVKGWSFDRTEAIITKKIQHFRINNKDYIVFADRLKTYILDRRGNIRVKLNQTLPKSSNNNFIFENRTSKSDPRLVITDTKGTIHFIYFSGKVETLNIKEFSANHFFDYQDLDGNGYKDFIFLENGLLEVFRQNKSKMFSYDFNLPIDLNPVCYTFSGNDRKIGVVSGSENKIYLINNNGEMYKGFPLSGNTLFSISKMNPSSNKFNLIVGNEDNFLYNYSVK